MYFLQKTSMWKRTQSLKEGEQVRQLPSAARLLDHLNLRSTSGKMQTRSLPLGKHVQKGPVWVQVFIQTSVWNARQDTLHTYSNQAEATPGEPETMKKLINEM